MNLSKKTIGPRGLYKYFSRQGEKEWILSHTYHYTPKSITLTSYQTPPQKLIFKHIVCQQDFSPHVSITLKITVQDF